MRRHLGSLGLLVAGMALLWSAGRFHGVLIHERSDFMPGTLATIEEDTPPLVALTQVALGGFRGLLADALWLRVTRVQDEGKYFEIVQLADWITKLEPRFTPAWAYHAWNMAYNVSVLLDDPAERWRWVQQGISILRDRALVYNPENPQLYWELGWLYQHKIGQNLDQAHLYYKTALAMEMQNLLGGPTPDFERLFAAATSKEDLLRRPGVPALIARLEAMKIDPFSLTALRNPKAPADLAAALSVPAATDELLPYLVRRRLETGLKFDLERMRRVEEETGPLDWRMPQAHSIYWAEKGLEFSTGFDLVRNERMVFQSLADAFRTGAAVFDFDGNLIPSSNLDLMPRVREAFERGIRENPRNETIHTAYRNFLEEAVGLFNIYHRLDEGKALYADLQRLYPSPEPDMSYEEFVVASLGEDIERLSSRAARNLVEAMVQQSYMWYTIGDLDRYAGFERFARLLWTRYMDNFQSEEHRQRSGLPPFAVIQDQALERMVESVGSETARQRLNTALQQKRRAAAAAAD